MNSQSIATIALPLLLALVASSLGYSKAPPNHSESRPAAHAVILLYHHVADDTPAITSIKPKDFEQQLNYLADNGFQVWPLEKIIEVLQSAPKADYNDSKGNNSNSTDSKADSNGHDSKADSKGQALAGSLLPNKVIAITFDDSYQSVYTQAFPRLKKRGWPFTIFVTTNAIDQGFNNQTSWEQLREMSRHGATIANHSASHDHLLIKQPKESQRQWRQRVSADIEQAQQRIREEIGHAPALFAYPYGEYNAELITLVAALGYTAFGQHSGAIGNYTPWQAIPRFPFAGAYSSLEDFATKAETLSLPISRIEHPQNPLLHKTAKPVLKIHLARPLTATLQCFASGQGAIEVSGSDQVLRIQAAKDIPVGRSRYNCTTRHSSGRFYWFSQPWIRLDKDNEWIAD